MEIKNSELHTLFNQPKYDIMMSIFNGYISEKTFPEGKTWDHIPHVVVYTMRAWKAEYHAIQDRKREVERNKG